MTERGPGAGVTRRLAAAIATFLIVPAAVSAATPPTPLPSPLTLEQALALAEGEHPDLALAHAGLARARARALAAGAQDDARLTAELTPQRVEPAAGNGSINDSRARLVLSKPLYDFGRTQALESSAAAEREAQELRLIDARAARRLEVMARYFDVLLADLRYAVDNETMAYLYVRFDRLRERAQLGQVSEVDLLEGENRYREALNLRTDSDKRRAATRLQLALALNRPEEIPRTLVRPELSALARELPEYPDLVRGTLESNSQLRAMRRDVEAARSSMAGERARRRPLLTGEIEVAEYERALASRDEARATLNLRIPLYQGSEVDAAVAQASAELAAREARLAKAEHEVRRALLDAVQEIEALKVRRETARQRVAFRDLYLDRARGLYELEVQTNLGDALAKLTEAQWAAAKVDFELALAWARLDALTGTLLQSSGEKEKP
jgi:outer membrane protein TolC